MSSKKGRKAPEFYCPIKYRASIPNHTIFPSLFTPSPFSLNDEAVSALLAYRPTAMEMTAGAVPFDVLSSELCDFVDLSKFAPAASKPADEHDVAMAEVEEDIVVDIDDAPSVVGEEEHGRQVVKRIPLAFKRSASLSLVAFDHDPHPTVDSRLAELPMADSVVVMQLAMPASEKTVDYEARRPTGQESFEFWVIDGDLQDGHGVCARSISDRFHLRKKR